MINDHPTGTHPFAVSLLSKDGTTVSGVAHRKLGENGHNDVFLDFMVPALQNHHISPNALDRRKDLVQSLRIANIPILPSPYPQNATTEKGNFAEVFLAEYLRTTTEAQIPVYRLRYNPNVDQSMKGDDVLLFDMDSDPVRIIVGEAKFRGTPTKQAVVDTIDGLVRSNKAGLPVSLMFVADRLFEEGKNDIAKKVQDCALLFATNKLRIDYVGLLMSNCNASNHVNNHTTNELHNLLMISLGTQSPEKIVQQSFARLGGAV
ncbi:MAG: DUF1837 domain-containing protein [Firmicutes bacterium]|nr:DUF1837 domain-containing protein [Bacillota bacterium]